MMKAIPVLASVSLIPGLCMLLALNLGMRLGVGRTLWMMAGELTALALMALFVLFGLSALVFSTPMAYLAMKIFGGVYLAYVGISIILSSAPRTDQEVSGMATSRLALARLGFIAGASNPKAWILYTAMLPALLLPQQPLMPQALQLTALLVVIEFASLLLYASGGHGLRVLLSRKDIVRSINIVLGSMIVLSALALLISP